MTEALHHALAASQAAAAAASAQPLRLAASAKPSDIQGLINQLQDALAKAKGEQVGRWAHKTEVVARTFSQDVPDLLINFSYFLLGLVITAAVLWVVGLLKRVFDALLVNPRDSIYVNGRRQSLVRFWVTILQIVLGFGGLYISIRVAEYDAAYIAGITGGVVVFFGFVTRESFANVAQGLFNYACGVITPGVHRSFHRGGMNITGFILHVGLVYTTMIHSITTVHPDNVDELRSLRDVDALPRKSRKGAASALSYVSRAELEEITGRDVIGVEMDSPEIARAISEGQVVVIWVYWVPNGVFAQQTVGAQYGGSGDAHHGSIPAYQPVWHSVVHPPGRRHASGAHDLEDLNDVVANTGVAEDTHAALRSAGIHVSQRDGTVHVDTPATIDAAAITEHRARSELRQIHGKGKGRAWQ